MDRQGIMRPRVGEAPNQTLPPTAGAFRVSQVHASPAPAGLLADGLRGVLVMHGRVGDLIAPVIDDPRTLATPSCPVVAASLQSQAAAGGGPCGRAPCPPLLGGKHEDDPL